MCVEAREVCESKMHFWNGQKSVGPRATNFAHFSGKHVKTPPFQEAIALKRVECARGRCTFCKVRSLYYHLRPLWSSVVSSCGNYLHLLPPPPFKFLWKRPLFKRPLHWSGWSEWSEFVFLARPDTCTTTSSRFRALQWPRAEIIYTSSPLHRFIFGEKCKKNLFHKVCVLKHVKCVSRKCIFGTAKSR